MADLRSFESTRRPIVLVGAGVLGRRIACSFVAGGHNVHVCDVSPTTLDDAVAFVEAHRDEYAQHGSRGKVKAPHRSRSNNDATGTTTSSSSSCTAFTSLEEAVHDAWLVIEAIPEQLDRKRELFGQLDGLAPADCIFASNSSSFKSSLMVDGLGTQRRSQLLNMHFSMLPGNRTVELMTDGCTAAGVMARAKALLEDCAMLPVVVRVESTGFIINRLWAAVKREILLMLAEGVSSPSEIDTLWEHMFHNGPPPCRLMDEIGLDTVALIEDHYVQERQLDGQMTVGWLREHYVSPGRLGNKSRLGGLYGPDEAA